MATLVLCGMSNCIYLVDKGKEQGAYRWQCDNDEIEIGLFTENRPCCYSYCAGNKKHHNLKENQEAKNETHIKGK